MIGPASNRTYRNWVLLAAGLNDVAAIFYLQIAKTTSPGLTAMPNPLDLSQDPLL